VYTKTLKFELVKCKPVVFFVSDIKFSDVPDSTNRQYALQQNISRLCARQQQLSTAKNKVAIRYKVYRTIITSYYWKSGTCN